MPPSPPNDFIREAGGFPCFCAIRPVLIMEQPFLVLELQTRNLTVLPEQFRKTHPKSCPTQRGHYFAHSSFFADINLSLIDCFLSFPARTHFGKAYIAAGRTGSMDGERMERAHTPGSRICWMSLGPVQHPLSLNPVSSFPTCDTQEKGAAKVTCGRHI